MERAKVVRGLRIAWTAWWGILCVLLIVLWALSYYRPTDPPFPLFTSRDFAVHSKRGLMIAAQGLIHDQTSNNSNSPFFPNRTQLVDGARVRPHLSWSGFHFHLGVHRWTWFLQLPYWFLVMLAAALAARTISWSRRFSLTTLFVATTLISVVLGLVMGAIRS